MVSASDRKELQKFVELEEFLEKKMDRIAVPQELGGCNEDEVMQTIHTRSQKPRRNNGRGRGKGNAHGNRKTNINRAGRGGASR
jgi:hypothetical protein